MRHKPDISSELGVATIFGGVVMGIITGWEDGMVLAFFYAYSFAIGLFCIRVNDGPGDKASITSASLWAILSFLFALPLLALIISLIERVLS
jgi:hypothetical protein